MKILSNILIISIALFSCNSKTAENKNETSSTGKTEQVKDFGAMAKRDTTLENGEKISRYPNGVIKMKGTMANGKRDGVWQSWYDNGLQWSETTFENGIKNGKTTTWFNNGQKRYEGFYTNDKESGHWVFWNEKGKQVKTMDYPIK